jgi:hypothetical protein
MESMGTYLIVAAQFRSEGVAFEILMNGALAYEDRAGVIGHHFAKLNPWLTESENVFSVRLALPEGAAELVASASFGVQVLQGEHGREPGPEGLLFEAAWSPATPPPLGIDFVEVMAATIRPAQTHGRWSWEDATPYTPAERPAVEALVAELHGALDRRDTAAAVGLFPIYDAEMDIALDLPPGAHTETFRAQLDGLFSAPDWRMEPLDTRSLVLTPRAGGRLVDVRGPGGGSPIRGAGSGGVFTLKFAVSRLGEVFRIVR